MRNTLATPPTRCLSGDLALLVVDASGVVSFAHGLDAVGLTSDHIRDLTGQSIDNIPRTNDRLLLGLQRAMGGQADRFELHVGKRTFDVRLEPRSNGGAVVSAAGTSEEELTARLRRLEEAQRFAHVGSFEWDIEADVLTLSDELHRIYGVERARFGGTYAAFLDRVHPDDLAHVKGVLSDAVMNTKPFAFDHRLVRHDGSLRSLHTRGDVITDDQSRAIRLVGSSWDETDLTESVRHLEHALSLLEAIINATADGLLVVDRAGKVTKYNQRFLAQWHIPQELVEQRDDQRLLTFVLDQLEDPEGFLRGVRELYGDPRRESFDVLRFKDGRVLERYSTPQRIGEKVAGRVWSFRDVTERERLLVRAVFLADAARLLGSLEMDSALDGVAHMAVPYLGDGCAIDLLGYGGPRRLLVVTRDPARPIKPELHSAILSGHPTIYTVGPLCYMGVPLVVKNAVVGGMTFVAAPNRRYTEDDLEVAEDLARQAALSVENAHLYRRAQDALQARDEFLSVAAHEIRGPITSLHLAAQSLQKGKMLAASVPQALDIIEREDRRLGTFVDELLDLGRIGTGRFHFTFEEVDLGDVVRDVTARSGAELAKCGSSLAITTEGVLVGQWDRFRLEQIVSHLLSNAMKFGLGKPISIAVSSGGGGVTLIVSDHGTGIAPEMHERIFQPFERAVSARNYGGLGLGLHIVRTIVEGLGGSVRVESQLGRGASFIVELPQSGSS
jgi:signal transduction histidine kinase/PAS domain-containing protein